MTDSFPPDDPFDLEAELDRLARIIFSRRSGIPLVDLDTWFEVHPSERDELDRILNSLRRPSWIDGGVRVIEVTDADPADADMVYLRGARAGQSFAVLRTYSLHTVRRHSIFRWALNFGQSRSQS